MATKGICCAASVLTAIFLLGIPPGHSMNSYPVDKPVVSVAEHPWQNDSGDLGDLPIGRNNGPIRGILDRTVPFEVVPREEFTFEMKLQNLQGRENTGMVILRLDSPDGDMSIFFEEQISLDGLETISFPFGGFVPGNLGPFGRYTLKLFIDDRLQDFFQFDYHSRETIEVRWDDGVIVDGWAFEYLCNAWAIKGCLPDGAILDSVGVYILSEGDPYWPWPDGTHQDILIQIFDNDGEGGLPGTLIYSDVTRVTPGTSHAVVYPGIAISSAFYMANDQLTDYPGCEAQGVDEEVNHPDQMFTRIDNVWENAGRDYYGDFMIWGVAHFGDRQFISGNFPGAD